MSRKGLGILCWLGWHEWHKRWRPECDHPELVCGFCGTIKDLGADD